MSRGKYRMLEPGRHRGRQKLGWFFLPSFAWPGWRPIVRRLTLADWLPSLPGPEYTGDRCEMCSAPSRGRFCRTCIKTAVGVGR